MAISSNHIDAEASKDDEQQSRQASSARQPTPRKSGNASIKKLIAASGIQISDIQNAMEMMSSNGAVITAKDVQAFAAKYFGDMELDESFNHRKTNDDVHTESLTKLLLGGGDFKEAFKVRKNTDQVVQSARRWNF